VRVDSGLAPDLVIGTDYDPMLAKIVARGRDRAEARRRLDAALAGTAVLGVRTNVAFLRRLLAHPDVAAGRLDTELIDREADGLAGTPEAPGEALAVAALALLADRGGDDPWDRVDGWRVGAPAETLRELDGGGGPV
ncbi:MAG TPA: hypothetical protein VKV25_05110, partial [Acidimicrobiales bacterium]|nr:hypothetical protein [Acidimicrobiales bacterium]